MADEQSQDGSTPNRRLGRPRKFDIEHKAEAAMWLFWKQGYRATATRDLEAALGLSQSSLYNAFGSKWGIMEAALDRYEVLFGKELLEPLERSDGLDGIDAFFTSLKRWVFGSGRRGCMLANLTAEDGGETVMFADRWNKTRERLHRAFVASLTQARNSGEMHPAIDIQSRAELLRTLAHGLSVAGRGAGRNEIQRMLTAAHSEIARWRCL